MEEGLLGLLQCLEIIKPSHLVVAKGLFELSLTIVSDLFIRVLLSFQSHPYSILVHSISRSFLSPQDLCQLSLVFRTIWLEKLLKIFTESFMILEIFVKS